MTFKVLAINPGSTSTKLGFYHNTDEVFSQSISHSSEEIGRYACIAEQYAFRLDKIQAFLAEKSLSVKDLSAVVGRGGLLKPVASGTYLVNEQMLEELTCARYGAHASNLGAVLADAIAREAGCPAYIVDPVVVDELAPKARITGFPEFQKRSIFHALNQKAVAKRYARAVNRRYEDLNLIVAHLGGGISVGCHKQGQVVDVNNALDGDGPFSPERSGTVQAGQFIDLIQSKGLSRQDVARRLAGQGGLVAHLGTNDAREVEQRIQAGDQAAALVYDAMIYNIARYIAASAVAVNGRVDQVLITGGIAYSKYLTDKLKEYIGFIAPVTILPGENELQALAEGAYRVLTGEESAKIYR